jgi:hypothetical protein
MTRRGIGWFGTFILGAAVAFGVTGALTGLMTYTAGALAAATLFGFALGTAERPETFVVGPSLLPGRLSRQLVDALRPSGADLPATGVSPAPAPQRPRTWRYLGWGVQIGVALYVTVVAFLLVRNSESALVSRTPPALLVAGGPAPEAAIQAKLLEVWERARSSVGPNGYPRIGLLETSVIGYDEGVVFADGPERVGSDGAVVVDAKRSTRSNLVLYAGAPDHVWQLTSRDRGRPVVSRVGSYEALVLTDAPAAYWRLDEVGTYAEDTSGLGNRGRYQGRPRSIDGAPGIGGHAVSFDGGAATVEVDVPEIALGTTRTATVELWLQLPGPGVNDGRMPFGFRFYCLFLSGGDIGFNTGNGDLFGGRHPAIEGGWHHIVAVFRSGGVRRNRIMVDGRSLRLSQREGRSVRQALSREANISGSPSGHAGSSIVGVIDEVAVYDYALPDRRGRAHYLAARAQAR